jgi:hypothetical protein
MPSKPSQISVVARTVEADALTVAGVTMAQGAAVADLAATTNITAVPAEFADLAAVRTYLAGANVVPNIETRLDNLEAKVNAILAQLRASGVIGT